MPTTSRLFLSLALIFSLVLLLPASAQTFSVVQSLDCSADGCGNQQAVPLTQGRNGFLYAQSYSGGSDGEGTVWYITPAGVIVDLWNFTDHTINEVHGGLTLALDGNFYGTFPFGGANGEGYVFKLTPSGVLTNLHSFNANVEGGYPNTPPALGPDGNLYGFVIGGPRFYKITVSSGAFSLLAPIPATSFSAYTLGADGTFYAVSFSGGANGLGAVLRITTTGVVTTLHSFTGADGQNPTGVPVQATDGNFYGTTSATTANSSLGTIYKITPAGKFTLLHTLAADGSEGTNMFAGLVSASDGNLYGVTTNGGTENYGVIFQITRAGVLKVVHNFVSTDGSNPWVPLCQRTDGTLYGVANGGGASGSGDVFKLTSTTFKRFITVQNYAAKALTTVDILGNGFAGATAVNFGSVAATSFKVANDTFMTAVVPLAAVTGPVSITTPTGTVSSLKSLRVLPTVTAFSPASGSVGTSVIISGSAFTGATKVAFGGVAASQFTVNSVTQITTIVPTGAVTGEISVITPSGTGISATTFTVD